MTKYILRGRSIDGTVYKTSYGWTSEMLDADLMTKEAAEQVLHAWEDVNRKVELDKIIGHLTLIEEPAVFGIKRAVHRYMSEGNTVDDLIEQITELYYPDHSKSGAYTAFFDQISKELEQVCETPEEHAERISVYKE